MAGSDQTPKPREANPLVERVDALLRREAEGSARQEPDVPVLTEVVDEEARRLPRTFDAAALEALAHELERAVLARLGPEVERVIEEKIARTLSGVLGQALEGVRAELTVSVIQMVREAVAASVAQALGQSAPK